MTRTTALILALLAAPLLASTLSIGESFTGEGTYYGAGQDSRGACGGRGFSTGPGGVMTVALNAPQFGSGNGPCGMCVEGSGTGVGAGGNPIGRFFATVNNLCPECKHGDLDFALNGDGRWKIQWKVVDCKAGAGRRLLYDNMRWAAALSNGTLQAAPQASRKELVA